MADTREKFGVEGNEVTYSAMINGLCMDGHMLEAYRMLKEMTELGCPPNFRTFQILLRGCVRWGFAVLAETIVYQDMDTFDVEPTMFVYAYLNKCLCQVK